MAVADLTDGSARFDAITLYRDLSSQKRPAYTNLSATFADIYADFRRAAPAAGWADFTGHAARTPAGRHALAAWSQRRRLLSFTQAVPGARTGCCRVPVTRESGRAEKGRLQGLCPAYAPCSVGHSCRA